MTPTNELRWVKKQISIREVLKADGLVEIQAGYDTVLQQKWVLDRFAKCHGEESAFEWRDVPVVEEENK